MLGLGFGYLGVENPLGFGGSVAAEVSGPARPPSARSTRRRRRWPTANATFAPGVAEHRDRPPGVRWEPDRSAVGKAERTELTRPGLHHHDISDHDGMRAPQRTDGVRGPTAAFRTKIERGDLAGPGGDDHELVDPERRTGRIETVGDGNREAHRLPLLDAHELEVSGFGCHRQVPVGDQCRCRRSAGGAEVVECVGLAGFDRPDRQLPLRAQFVTTNANIPVDRSTAIAVPAGTSMVEASTSPAYVSSQSGEPHAIAIPAV